MIFFYLVVCPSGKIVKLKIIVKSHSSVVKNYIQVANKIGRLCSFASTYSPSH